MATSSSKSISRSPPPPQASSHGQLPPPPSLKERILQSKQRLRNVETTVITPDGRELLEKRDAAGVISTTQVSVRPWGFVGDLKPDLQLAEIAPQVFLGWLSYLISEKATIQQLFQHID